MQSSLRTEEHMAFQKELEVCFVKKRADGSRFENKTEYVQYKKASRNQL